ncbi:MAG: TonB-dependent receptor domain-containing protein, partial [Acidimicrobiia bacterium]
NTLSGTYNFDKGERSPFGILGNLNGVGTKSKKQVVGAKWTSVLSSASVNEIHFGYSDSEPEGDIPLTDINFADRGLVFRTDRVRMGEINVLNSNISGIGYRVDPSRYRQRGYTLKEGFSLARGNHSYRIGGEWTYYRYNVASCSRGCNGVWEFNSLTDFLRANPRRLDIMLPGGDIVSRDMRQHLLGVYFQDNWRAGEDLTLNLGLRYEFASTIDEVNDKVSNLIHFTDTEVTVGNLYKNPTKKSFSPRVGFVWAPGEGKYSVRGGFGVFYEHPMLYNVRTSLQELPPFTLVGRIQRSGIDFPNAFFTQIASANPRPNIRTFQYELDQTYMYRWSLTLQRQFWNNWVASADYTGSRGLHLWQQTLPNLNRWQGWPEQPPAGTEKFFPLLPSGTTNLINPNFGEMRIQYSNANSYYHGGSLAVQKRLSAGVQFQAAFTYSKAIDDGSGVTSGGDELPQSQRGIYAWDMYLKRGLSSYDVRKVFTANVSYELPWGRDLTGVAGVFAKGWQVNSVITLSDGYPLSVDEESAFQVRAIGDDEDLRPDLIPGGNQNPVTGNPDRWFDISQFTPARIGHFGTLGRNTVISPGLASVDLSVFKNIDLGANGRRLQFRIETFNLFNRANFGTPNMTAFFNEQPNPQAGQITRTRTPARQMQLGLRWVF